MLGNSDLHAQQRSDRRLKLIRSITVTVNVANNAPASVTNSVTVSGGGQTNTANDTATDPTTINQLAGPDDRQEPHRQLHSGTSRRNLFDHRHQFRLRGDNGGRFSHRHLAGRADRDGHQRDRLELRARHSDMHAQ